MIAAGRGLAWRDKAWLGEAGRGLAWRDKTSQGNRQGPSSDGSFFDPLDIVPSFC